MQSGDFGGRAATARPPSEDAAVDSIHDSARHDPIADLIERIRDAALRGEPLAVGATVTVRKVRQGLFKVERP